MTRNRIPLIQRPGAICVLSNDRATHPQFSAALAVIHYTPGTKLLWQISGGGGVAGARNKLVRQALEHFDGRPGWIWFVDDDHTFQKTILDRMLKHDKDLLVPLVLSRKPPFDWVAYRYAPARADMTNQELRDVWKACNVPPLVPHKAGSLVELGHGGTGGLLISTEVIRALDDPWFEFGKLDTDDAGEDSWFILKARREGFRMFCDLGSTMSHMNTCAVWPRVDTATGKITPLIQFDAMRTSIAPHAFTVGTYVDPHWRRHTDDPDYFLEFDVEDEEATG